MKMITDRTNSHGKAKSLCYRDKSVMFNINKEADYKENHVLGVMKIKFARHKNAKSRNEIYAVLLSPWVGARYIKLYMKSMAFIHNTKHQPP